jgi:hydrogenase maturation protease
MATLIIGYGSLLRGDDSAGRHVADSLTGSQSNETITVLSVHQLTPELADPISRSDMVIFIDAAAEGRPGEVNVFPLAQGAYQQGSHQTTPDGLLAMADELFGQRPQGYMVTITGESFEISDSLSPAVASAVPQAINRVLDLIHKKESLDLGN